MLLRFGSELALWLANKSSYTCTTPNYSKADLHVEPEPGSSLGATLRARGREVRRDELVSNKFHVCVGQKIGVPPKLREHGVGSGVVSVGEHEEDEEEDFNAFIANL